MLVQGPINKYLTLYKLQTLQDILLQLFVKDTSFKSLQFFLIYKKQGLETRLFFIRKCKHLLELYRLSQCINICGRLTWFQLQTFTNTMSPNN